MEYDSEYKNCIHCIQEYVKAWQLPADFAVFRYKIIDKSTELW